LADCSDVLPPTVSIGDAALGEGEGAVGVVVSLSEASTTAVTVEVSTADATATAPDDYAALSAVSVTFAPGEMSRTVQIAVVDDSAVEGEEMFSVLLGNAQGAEIGDGAGIVTIADDEETTACGAPGYDKASEQGVFVWKDCDTGEWQARLTAAGESLAYQGSVMAPSAVLGVSEFSIEANDVLENAANPSRIDYTLYVSGTGQDGFGFTLSADEQTCFVLDAPASMPVYVGAARTPVPAAFDLATLSSCN
jgi:hypothetical protein